jgi:hypothetical protein
MTLEDKLRIAQANLIVLQEEMRLQSQVCKLQSHLLACVFTHLTDKSVFVNDLRDLTNARTALDKFRDEHAA